MDEPTISNVLPKTTVKKTSESTRPPSVLSCINTSALSSPPYTASWKKSSVAVLKMQMAHSVTPRTSSGTPLDTYTYI
ncbi:hypothetical protein B0H19DRAFT_1137902, partial [Mycena capillaripes]